MPFRRAQNATAESSGSQIPEHAIMYRSGDTLDQHAEPRVGLRTMGKLRAPTAKYMDVHVMARQKAEVWLHSYTPTQKRTCKSAVRRATNSSQEGTTGVLAKRKKTARRLIAGMWLHRQIHKTCFAGMAIFFSAKFFPLWKCVSCCSFWTPVTCASFADLPLMFWKYL